LFFEFGGLSTLLRQAFGGQAVSTTNPFDPPPQGYGGQAAQPIPLCSGQAPASAMPLAVKQRDLFMLEIKERDRVMYEAVHGEWIKKAESDYQLLWRWLDGAGFRPGGVTQTNRQFPKAL
jgi:hypothetical protein